MAIIGDDEAFYSPTKKRAPPRQPKPGERLFEFRRGSDHFACELRDHVEFGVEAQFLLCGQLFFAQTFPSRALAVRWAAIERNIVEKGRSA